MQLNFATYSTAADITKSDTTILNCRAIYVGGAGDVTVKPQSGATAVTFKAPPVGTILPVQIDGGMVMAATTATLLVALS